MNRKHFKSLFAWTSMFVLLFSANTANSARYENLNVGNLVVERSIVVSGLLQAAANTTGDVYYVKSGGVNGLGSVGKSSKSPLATLDYAIGRCTANNGDFIIVMPGHAESYTAADGFDVDVAGVTIIGLGEGAARPTFTFADTDATVAIGAANVKVANVRFLAGISAVVIGVAVEDAGDNFTLIGCEFPEPTTSTFEFVDSIDLESGADGVHIIGNTAYNIDAVGAAHFIDAGNGVNKDLQIIDNLIMGEYSVSAIWSDTIDLEVLISGNNITNATNGQHAVEFTGAATGTIKDCLLRTDSNSTDLDPGSLTVSQVYWDDDTTADTVAIPTSTASSGADSIGGINDTTTDSLHGKIGTDTEMADSSLSDVLWGGGGIAVFPSAALPANNVSLAEVIREAYDQQEKSASGSTAVMVNGDTIFTIANGPIEILALVSECITVNDGTASTLQYTADPTVGAATTFSGASASLASAAAGSGVVLNGTALATAPDLVDPLVGLTGVHTRGVIVGAGVIKIVIGVGSTTGTWKHYIRYRPLARGVTVTGT
jgi:hypothetical protein